MVRCRGRHWVIKQFEHNRLRQVLSILFGIHPAQIEHRRARQMARDGLPVVPIVRVGVAAGRAWLTTPEAGTPLHRAIANGLLQDRKRADRVIAGVAELFCQLIRTGWYFRDFQVVNLVLTQDDQVYMIDVGGSRRSTSHRHAVHMLAMLGRSARLEGASRADVLRGLNNIFAQLPGLGPKRRLIDDVLRDPGAHDSQGRGL